MSKISKNKVLTRITVIDNSTNSDAQFQINAEAECNLGVLVAIHNGKVNNAEGKEIAVFSQYGDNQFSVTFWKEAENRAAVYAAIEAFIADTHAENWADDAAV